MLEELILLLLGPRTTNTYSMGNKQAAVDFQILRGNLYHATT